MFGIFGLAEAVDLLMERADHRRPATAKSNAANELSYRIVDRVADLVADRPMPYCEGNGGRCFLHSQSGIDLDARRDRRHPDPGRVEPPLVEHLLTVAPHHRRFAAGISDVLAFDDTAQRNPQAVVDVIRGAFNVGMRDFTFNLDSNDFIRITGYLVRKSDLAELPTEGARHASTYLAAGSVANSHVTERTPKRVISSESAAGSDR